MTDQTMPFRVLDRLAERGVRFVIIGGHAVNYHGYVRSTENVDVVFVRNSDSEEILFEELSREKAFRIGEEIDPATGLEKTHPVSREFIQRTSLMMLGVDNGWLDIFDFVPGLPDADVNDLIATCETSSGRPYVNLA